jgi:hypothetical protein
VTCPVSVGEPRTKFERISRRPVHGALHAVIAADFMISPDQVSSRDPRHGGLLLAASVFESAAQ